MTKSLAFDLTEDQMNDLIQISSVDGDHMLFIAAAFPDLNHEQHYSILTLCKSYLLKVRNAQTTFERLKEELLGNKPPLEILRTIKGGQDDGR